MGKIDGINVKLVWYSPRDGSIKEIGVFPNNGVVVFNPPGQQQNGNDWVLIIEKV